MRVCKSESFGVVVSSVSFLHQQADFYEHDSKDPDLTVYESNDLGDARLAGRGATLWGVHRRARGLDLYVEDK